MADLRLLWHRAHHMTCAVSLPSAPGFPPPAPAPSAAAPASQPAQPTPESASSWQETFPAKLSEEPARTAAAKRSTAPKLFLDLFAGVSAPLTAAMEALHADCMQPFDLDANAAFDIVDNAQYRLLLRAASSGILGALWSAPPCKEFSRLKLRKPGPKALRAPEFMDGVPGNSPAEQTRVDQSTEIHKRSRQVIRAARQSGSHTGLEQPPSSMPWLQPDNVTLLQEQCAHCAHVAACHHGLDLCKSWALCASFPSISSLACTCTHPPGMHRPIANVKVNDVYLSALTAEYPVSLAKQLAALMAPFCSSLGHKRVPLSHFSNLLPEPGVHRRPLVCDGAGMNSSADSSNASAAPSPLQDVITHWLQFAAQRNLTQSIVSHRCQARDAHPLTEAQQLEVATIAHSFLHPQCKDPACLRITPGQPFRLKLLQAFASRTKDPDHKLHSFLAEGVPAGILQDIPSSFQWQQRQQTLQEDDLDGLHLLHCQGNWTQAEQNPELLRQLLQKEVDNGWVVPFHGNASDAARQWPEGTAIGKLKIVSAEGNDPRLVLDSTICNANPLCKVPERVSLPTALDVQRTFLQGDRHGNFIGMSLDFKAAHKCVKVHRKEQGCLLFRVDSQVYHYTVCHFGAKFSAYWWQRVGGQLLRIAHALLQQHGHKAWLYVDDLLAMLAQATWQQQAVLLTFFISAINAPISWKKAQLGHRITWCGWTFHLDIEALHLVEGKLAKLRDQLDKLAKSKKILRKHLESSLGLLMWATSTCPHLRPYLAPLYKDLRSGHGTLHQVFARDWQRFVDSSHPRQWSHTNPQAFGSPQGPSSLKSDPYPCKASKTSHASRLHINLSGCAFQTPRALKFTFATRAGKHCSGCLHVSSMISYAPCASRPCCTAWQPLMPWQKATQLA